MAKNYDQLSKDIVKYIGGTENVISLFHCATRLRFKVKDTGAVDKENLSQLSGVIKVLDSGGQIQVVIGNHVADVCEAVFQNTGLKREAGAEEGGEKQNLLNTFMDTISGIFAPMLGAMSGAGMLKALLILLTTLNVLTPEMGTYRILQAAGDGVFTFLPIILAVTASKKFKANTYVAMGIAAALVYPDLTAAFSAGEALTFLKIPVVLVSYTASVIPIIISVYLLSKLEKAGDGKRIFGSVGKPDGDSSADVSGGRTDCRYRRKTAGFRLYRAGRVKPGDRRRTFGPDLAGGRYVRRALGICTDRHEQHCDLWQRYAVCHYRTEQYGAGRRDAGRIFEDEE